MSSAPRPDPPVLTVSPLLQFLVGLAVVAFLLNQALGLLNRSPARKPAQLVYLITPQEGNLKELQGLLDDGWRVTHVANAGTPGGAQAVSLLGFLMENPATREQDYIFFTPGPNQQASLDRITDLQRRGWRIANVNMNSAPAGGNANFYTTFVLER